MQPNFKLVWQAAIVLVLTVIGEVIVIDIGNLNGWNQTIYIITGALLLFTSIALVQWTWGIAPKIKNYLHFHRVENIRILPFLVSSDDGYDLIYFPTEWRYPMDKRLIYPSIPSLGENKFLIWRNASSESIKMWWFYRIKFIELNDENNTFSIITSRGKSENYDIGKHEFRILITSNIMAKIYGAQVAWRQF